MSPRLLINLIGAFTLWWLVYNLADSGLLPVVLLVATLVTIFAVRRRRKLRSTGTSVNHLKAYRSVKAMPSDSSSISPVPKSIVEALQDLPAALKVRSGSVFYTGRSAFQGERPLYILGLNPGGDPEKQACETVGRHIDEFQARTEPWSAYADDSWQGRAPGTWGMQPRLLHMLAQLGFDPREVPASNVLFARSRTESNVSAEKVSLLAACWPVHQAVIDALNIRVILCLGGTAGSWVRARLGAALFVDSFSETNARGWTSTAHRAPSGITVITATHPGRADWCNLAADPTELVRRMLI